MAERPAEVAASLDRLADAIKAHVDLDAVAALARSAPRRTAGPVPLPSPGTPIRVGVAAGQAFTFTYHDTLDALRAAGADVVAFDPLADDTLPEGLDGLVIGGGFPEVYAAELSANEPFLSDLFRAASGGLPIWAECGGLLLLCRSLDGASMAGVIPAAASMTGRLTLGYRDVITNVATPLGPAGRSLRGHEFHYSELEPAGRGPDPLESLGSQARGLGYPFDAGHLPAPPSGRRPGTGRPPSPRPAPYVIPYVWRSLEPVRKSSLYLPDRLKSALSARAAETGRSEADLIRDALGTRSLPARGVVRPARPDPAVPGRLVGVGVGPGEADLLTVRAVSALRRADRVLAPTTAVDAVGRAEAVVREAVPGIVVERVAFSMSQARTARDRSIEQAAATVISHLERGEEVAWITLGDPLVYSTFSALSAQVSSEASGDHRDPGAGDHGVSGPGRPDRNRRGRREVPAHREDGARRRRPGPGPGRHRVHRGHLQGRPPAARTGRTGGPAAAEAEAQSPASCSGCPASGSAALENLARPGPASYLATVIVPATDGRRIGDLIRGGRTGGRRPDNAARCRPAGRADVVIWASSLVPEALLDHCRSPAPRSTTRRP